jgi:hypothetical protein
MRDLTACSEVIVTEDLKPLEQQHILNDSTVEGNNKTKDNKLHYRELQYLSNSTNEARTNKDKAAEPGVGSYDSVGQHLLTECISDITADATNPILAGEISQHSLLECTEKNTEPLPVGSATLK